MQNQSRLPNQSRFQKQSAWKTDGVWKFAHTAQEAKEMGFYAVHVDSMGWAIGLGIIFIMLFSMVARKATTGVPSGLQNAVEIVIEFIDSNVKDTFSHKNKLGINKVKGINRSTVLTYPQYSFTDGVNGNRCIDLSTITFIHIIILPIIPFIDGENGNKYKDLSKISTYPHI